MSHYAAAPRQALTQISMRSVPLALVGLTLPFLDFPGIGGGAYVKPLALFIGLMIFAFQVLTRSSTLVLPTDWTMRNAFLFWGWAVIGALIMPWIVDAPTQMKGTYIGDRVLRDTLALTAGFLFWLFTRMQLRDPGRIMQALKYMLASFWIIVPFCVVQILVVVTHSDVARALDSVLSVVRTLQPGAQGYGKIFGTAPEGSMLADQIMSMYLPFCLAAIFQNTSVLRPGSTAPGRERLIAILAVAILIFTVSRIGFITLVGLLGCAYYLGPKLSGRGRKRIPVALIIAIVAVFGIGISLAGKVFSNFIGTFVGVDASIDEGVWSNVTRAGSMITGVKMGLDHPFGVGTGAFPFLFARYVPDWALIDPEVQALMGNNYDSLIAFGGSTSSDIAERLPDAKALLPRVLAEMGWPGLLLLVGSWFLLTRRCWLLARATQSPLERVIAFGCVLSLLTMVPLAFNVNSYVWVHWLFISAIAATLVSRSDNRRNLAKLESRHAAGV